MVIVTYTCQDCIGHVANPGIGQISNLGLVHQAKEFGKLMSIFWYQEWAARLILSASQNPTERMGIGAGADAQNRMSVTLIAEFRRKGSVRVLRGSL